MVTTFRNKRNHNMTAVTGHIKYCSNGIRTIEINYQHVYTELDYSASFKSVDSAMCCANESFTGRRRVKLLYLSDGFSRVLCGEVACVRDTITLLTPTHPLSNTQLLHISLNVWSQKIHQKLYRIEINGTSTPLRLSGIRWFLMSWNQNCRREMWILQP